MKEHELKIWPQYFEAVANGTKTFEVRKDDRGFCFGDRVVLREWNPDKPVVGSGKAGFVQGKEGGYTGRGLSFKIGYILQLADQLVVFSLLPDQLEPIKVSRPDFL